MRDEISVKAPTTKTVVKDKERKITYVILAYRKVSEAEAMEAIAGLHATLKKQRRKVEQGKTYEILTTLH